MATHKVYFVEVYVYVVIAANDQSANNFHIVRFKSVSYNLQEDVELDVDWIASRYIVYNSIFTYPGLPK